ncbi:hypothetical protein [Staphylococcus cohnii]|uniref:hypothetical protein n=1 Tax=Staphylococcus cohnii TaxID=29382 RepID=UPI003CF475BE
MAFSNFKLGDLVSYRNEKIQITEVNEENYVSTENLLPNRSGKQNASKLPNVKSVKRYTRDDILISNIRPYFKKSGKLMKKVEHQMMY